MKINLELRELTAYCLPCKVVLADNENVEVHILDKGQLRNRVVLSCNGKTFLANEDKTVWLPREDLKSINVLELTERSASTDVVLRRFTVENLYVMPCSDGSSNSTLLSERKFYQETFQELLQQVNLLGERQVDLEKRVADLENGKFTMLKFGGEEK